MRIFRERVKTSWDRDPMLLKGLLESRYHHRVYMNEIKQSKEDFKAFSGLHERVGVIDKTYPNLRCQIGLI
jgi:hypothetical protein